MGLTESVAVPLAPAVLTILESLGLARFRKKINLVYGDRLRASILFPLLLSITLVNLTIHVTPNCFMQNECFPIAIATV